MLTVSPYLRERVRDDVDLRSLTDDWEESHDLLLHVSWDLSRASSAHDGRAWRASIQQHNGLRREVAALESTLIRSPEPLWPFDADTAERDAADTRDAIAGAAAAIGRRASITGVDCTEYPCLVFGEVATAADFERLIHSDPMASFRSGSELWVARVSALPPPGRCAAQRFAVAAYSGTHPRLRESRLAHRAGLRLGADPGALESSRRPPAAVPCDG